MSLLSLNASLMMFKKPHREWNFVRYNASIFYGNYVDLLEYTLKEYTEKIQKANYDVRFKHGEY